MRTVPDRGDIILLSFDPTLGHEQAGYRPAVVLSPAVYNKASGLCLVCPITTKIKGYPFEVPLAGAQKTSGVALADQVRSIDWQVRQIKVIDHLSASALGIILAKFKPLLFE